MAGTISTTLTSSYTLNSNPTTVLSTGAVIVNTTLSAISGSAGTAWTLGNSGLIENTGSGATAIDFASGGSVYNAASGTILGDFGVQLTGSPMGAVTNAGIIGNSATKVGVNLKGGGILTNAVTGYIAGVDILGATGTIANAGSIMGDLFGCYFRGAASVINSGIMVGRFVNGLEVGGAGFHGTTVGTAVVLNDGLITGGTYNPALLAGGPLSLTNNGTIEGASGIRLTASSTVTNAGTIASTSTLFGNDYAISFYEGFSNLLVAEPGAVFTGFVYGGNTLGSSVVSTLELASASSAGTLSGLGTQFLDFGSIKFDGGADWFVSGNTSGLAGTIGGFAPGDTIELTGITVTGSSYADGILILDEAGGGSATLALIGSFTTSDFTVTNVAAGANVTVACFRAGTHVLTERGAVKVEALCIGDWVATMVGGRFAPVVWIGHRTVDCRRHQNPALLWPVRICADAFGPGQPSRDLFISPDHAVFVDNVLVPVKHLINGKNIVQVPTTRVTYYHVELPTHDVLFAEGLPAETYLAAADRTNFTGSDAPIALHPDFASRTWEAEGCAPLVVTGPALYAIRRRLSRQLATDDAVLPAAQAY